MSTLSDRDIKLRIESGDITIYPFDAACLQPASYDMHLGCDFKFISQRQTALSPMLATDMLDKVATKDHPLRLMQGQFCLATSIEAVELSENVIGRLEGKSSLARLGLIVHEAGFFDPGFKGQCTLELFNLAPIPILLYPGMKIVQMAFESLSSPAERPYGSPGLGSKYLGQTGPTASRAHLEA